MFKCFMDNKGFAEQQTNITTPNSFVIAEKPLKNGKKRFFETLGKNPRKKNEGVFILCDK